MLKIVNLKILPRSSINELIKISDTEWKVKLTSPPVDGRANQALIKLLAKELGAGKTQIEIVKGLRNKNKVVKIVF
ncbi:DUF167 domain-containing protein [Candidatus Parcubacteria bacterium]|nr:DUF167 domain-containing protein [Patescibacteria group bacterium]MCG2692525.1 DUF167 domain-containing protein [Candidatus Parcubacteria bacterium]